MCDNVGSAPHPPPLSSAGPQPSPPSGAKTRCCRHAAGEHGERLRHTKPTTASATDTVHPAGHRVLLPAPRASFTPPARTTAGPRCAAHPNA